MTYSPPTIRDAAAYLVEHGFTNLGIVGDIQHTYGYHLGKDRIYRPSGLGDRDYSVKHQRDKSGLTNGAAALDIGVASVDKSLLRSFSVWLVDQCREKAPGTQDIREVIYSPDGTQVLRWDRITGKVYANGGDNSHRWHTHIGWHRDAEYRNHTLAFAPYFEDDMPYEFKVERWALDGGPGKVTTLGAPKRTDGTVDYTSRLALLSGSGDSDKRLEELPRGRLSAPDASLSDEFYADLASYSRPTDTKHKVTVQVDGTTAAEVTV